MFEPKHPPRRHAPIGRYLELQHAKASAVIADAAARRNPLAGFIARRRAEVFARKPGLPQLSPKQLEASVARTEAYIARIEAEAASKNRAAWAAAMTAHADRKHALKTMIKRRKEKQKKQAKKKIVRPSRASRAYQQSLAL